MAKFTKVAEVTDIPAGEGRVVLAEGKTLAVFNVDGRFYAIENTCAHRGGPLGDGDLEGTVVTCPWHGWRWDVRTGVNALNESIKVGCYPVKVEGGSVLVEV